MLVKARGGDGGYSPIYIVSYMCRPKGMVFEPFWSEIMYVRIKVLFSIVFSNPNEFLTLALIISFIMLQHCS